MEQGVKLSQLIAGAMLDHQDEETVEIYDQNGVPLVRGKWYKDHVLAYADRMGVATYDTNEGITKFRLV